MRRAGAALVVTVASVVLLASFRTSGPRLALAPAAGSRTQPTARRVSAPAPTATTPTAHAAPPAKPSGTFKGDTVSTQYGPVQVAVTEQAGRITAVRALALPFDQPRSQFISQQVEPILRSEALSAQSARIDLVSGATYTSDGYAQSLQSALDRAHA